MVAGIAVLGWTVLSAWRAPQLTPDGSNSLARDDGSLWSISSDSLMGMTEMGYDEGVCGIGLLDVSWAGTGGYSYLHRNVPVYLIVD